MQESLALTRLLNQLFGPMVAAAMRVVGLHPAHPATPIDNTFALEFLVVFGLIVFFLIVRLTLSVEKPNPAQQVAEMIHEFTGSQAESVIGHGYERFQAFVTCVGLFIVLNNLIGLLIGFPGVETPTGNPSVPLGIAVLTFLYYNYHGLRVHGPIGYAKQFAGPIWWMSPLLFPVEIVSHLARMMSLTIRLYANMLASDMLTLAFFSLIPLLVPTAFLGLHFAVALIQAYVFMLLSIIYLGLAVSEEH
ncbi:ATP synthase subunit a [Candidatus Sulfotelmatomonas gaucii]|uniref:ATP synthase subunit a n=1 Tax=Candidatus Sulfuritelmatomonas gaucii TaxID=2043161 RepID=A0A2N9LAX3_9BACT|nr:ATP synthase subunit a [Candidatus Sulfotelmatomonas gaucii]